MTRSIWSLQDNPDFAALPDKGSRSGTASPLRGGAAPLAGIGTASMAQKEGHAQG